MAVGVVWLVLMVGAFYVLLWRPQQRRMGAARALQAQLREGDNVMTTSGIFGRVTRLGDNDADLEVAPGVTLHVARGAIGERLAGESRPEDAREDGSEAG